MTAGMMGGGSMGSRETASTVLTRYELDTMRAKTLPKPIEDRETRRMRLKALSDARVAKWPNTLAAVRQQKENWAKEKDERTENERRETDKKEAAIQRQLRMETIQKANARLYEQTERMKALRSTELYAEVLETRKAQVDEKEVRKEKERDREAYHFKVIQQQIKEGDEQAKRDKEARLATAAEIARQQKVQLQECKQIYVKRLLEEKQEGDAAQAQAVEAIQKEKEEAYQAKVHARLQLEKMLNANETLKEVRDHKHLEELALLEKCAEESRNLQNITQARKALESKRFADRQAVRQKLIDKACQELKSITDRTHELKEKEMKEQRAKEDAREQHKQEILKRQKEGVERGRALAMRLKKEREQEDRENDAKIKEYYKQQMVETEQRRIQGLKDIRDKNMEIRSFLEKQILERRQKKLAEEAYRQVEAERMESVKHAEQRRFKDILQAEKDAFEAKGYSTHLLTQRAC